MKATRGRRGFSAGGIFTDERGVLIVLIVVMILILGRQLFGQAPDGWIDAPEPPADARVIYVSPAGDNSNAGTEAAPERTIQRGYQMLRNGTADQLRLRAGGVWSEMIDWRKSGAAADAPMVLGVYDPDDSGSGPASGGRPVLQGRWYATAEPIRHLIIDGIEITAEHITDPRRRPSNGLGLMAPADDVTIQDVLIRGHRVGMVIQPPAPGMVQNLIIHRCIVIDNYSTDSHSQGAFVKNTSGTIISASVFDHNGWRESVPAAIPTKFHHNLYLTRANENLHLIGNLISRASNHAFTVRPGRVESNLIIGNSINGFAYGASEVIGNVVIRPSGKLVANQRGADPDDPAAWGRLGWGMDLSSAATVRANILACGPPTVSPLPDPLRGMDPQWRPQNIVWAWGVYSDAGPYADPDRIVQLDTDALIDAARTRARRTWPAATDPQAIIMHLADGFRTAGAPPPPPPPPDPEPQPDPEPIWNLTESEWLKLVARVQLLEQLLAAEAENRMEQLNP